MMINLTPHPITIRLPDGTDRTYQPDGSVARVAMQETVLYCTPDGVPVVRRTPGEVIGLPRNSAGIVPCLVSSMVLAALPAGTLNVYAPDTGPTAIRDERGQVIAVTRLVTA